MVDVTFTVIKQTAPGAIVALFRVNEPAPLAPVNVAVAPQPFKVAATGFARITPAGRLSVKVVCVNAVFGSTLLIAIDNWLVCPTHIVFGVNNFPIRGGWTEPTRNVALAGVVLVIVPPPPVPVKPPAGIVLIKLPGVFEVTSTEMVHDPGVTPT